MYVARVSADALCSRSTCLSNFPSVFPVFVLLFCLSLSFFSSFFLLSSTRKRTAARDRERKQSKVAHVYLHGTTIPSGNCLTSNPLALVGNRIRDERKGHRTEEAKVFYKEDGTVDESTASLVPATVAPAAITSPAQTVFDDLSEDDHALAAKLSALAGMTEDDVNAALQMWSTGADEDPDGKGYIV